MADDPPSRFDAALAARTQRIAPMVGLAVAATIGAPCRFRLRRHLQSQLHLDPPAQG